VLRTAQPAEVDRVLRRTYAARYVNLQAGP